MLACSSEDSESAKGGKMKSNDLILPGSKLMVSHSETQDGLNDGSIAIVSPTGCAYCIAKAPRYATDKVWKHNANLIVQAIQEYFANHAKQPKETK